MTEIENSVLSFIREERPDLAIELDTELMEAGILDSISLIKSIQFMEQTFGIKIPDSDIDLAIFATPRAIAGYVAGKSGGAAAPARAPEAVPAE
jgi:acyl carrier protein